MDGRHTGLDGRHTGMDGRHTGLGGRHTGLDGGHTGKFSAQKQIGHAPEYIPIAYNVKNMREA